MKLILGEIRKCIPLGFNHHKKAQDEKLMPTIFDFDGMIVEREYQSALKQVGTLGGTNHFIEIQKGSDGYIWIMLHSGSRNLGHQVASHYNKIAIELNQKWYSAVPTKWDLAFLPLDSEEGQAYLREMNYCVNFAFASRKLMMDRIIKIFQEQFEWEDEIVKEVSSGMINIAHNYATLENHFGHNVMVHRKGATLASDKTIGLIPGSQGSKSYVVRGKNNRDSFRSCSHGAGRAMSATMAVEKLDFDGELALLNGQGILHTIRNKNDLSEATGAYKDITTVMKNQEDLVEILVELSPLATVKGPKELRRKKNK